VSPARRNGASSACWSRAAQRLIRPMTSIGPVSSPGCTARHCRTTAATVSPRRPSAGSAPTGGLSPESAPATTSGAGPAPTAGLSPESTAAAGSGAGSPPAVAPSTDARPSAGSLPAARALPVSPSPDARTSSADPPAAGRAPAARSPAGSPPAA
jgi:hypothetical protein